jgi:prepilin-type N-terminal cleavage/methylation domain-containing protein
MRRNAFTAVEMLIVVAIIGILAGLLLPGVTMMRNRAKMVATTVKVQAVTTGLQQAGSERDLVAMLVDRLAGFSTPPAPATLVYPPGQRYRGGSGSWTRESIALNQYSPEFSVALLHYAGVFDDAPIWGSSASDKASDATLRTAAANAYDNERGPKHPWNDAFGNPLVVAYAYWDSSGLGTTTKDVRPRGISVSVGATGSIAAGSGAMSSSARLSAMWSQINAGCDKNGEWKVNGSVNAWDAPPWQGIKSGKHKPTGSTCVISAPMEIP